MAAEGPALYEPATKSWASVRDGVRVEVLFLRNLCNLRHLWISWYLDCTDLSTDYTD
jgi:hypothetical protein